MRTRGPPCGRPRIGRIAFSPSRRPRSATSCTSSTCRRRRWWWCTTPSTSALHERLIEAFHALRQRGLDDLKLLIIGDQISSYPSLRRAVHRHKLHKHVRFLGYLPDETLSVMYRLASVFVFPSLYEGFGLPALEAMASGTPVVTSNVSSLPEVTGDAAVLVDPYDVGAIEAGIHRVLTDPVLAADMRRKGLLRAREFSWERSVRRTLGVYQKVGHRRAESEDRRKETGRGAAATEVAPPERRAGVGEEDASERSATLP